MAAPSFGSHLVRVTAESFPAYQRWPWGTVFAWLVIVAALTNAILFTWQAAIPVVISDAWYYLDVFVRKVLDGTLSFADLFVKRGPQDHSLPLHKLVLLANVHWFGLDFTLEAFVGLLFAIASLLLILRLLIVENHGCRNISSVVWLAFASICGVYLSLNASAIFEWPLLTMGFSVQFFFLLLFVASWHATRDGRSTAFIAFGVCATLAMVVADGGGLIAVIATGGGVSLLAMRGGSKPRALIALAILAGVVLLHRYAMGLIVPLPERGDTRHALLSVLARPSLFPDAVNWVRAALADSVAHGTNLQQRFGTGIGLYQTTIACLVAAGHCWFWWQALRRPPTIVRSVAVCIMLLFYGLLAGIVIARVPQFGNDYLHQPRYVIFYQLNLVALLMMGAAQISEKTTIGPGVRMSGAGLVFASALLLLVQLQVSKYSWKREPFQQKYVEMLALQMGELARDPDHQPRACSPLLIICRQPAAKRRELIEMLSRNQLNVFSANFRTRHELQIQ